MMECLDHQSKIKLMHCPLFYADQIIAISVNHMRPFVILLKRILKMLWYTFVVTIRMGNTSTLLVN